MASYQVPNQVPLTAALQGSAPLAGLLQRIRQSQARLDAIAPLLPAALRQAVRPGPLDDSSWALLVANSAAAAKLRQMLPQLQAGLSAQGWPALDIRLKVQRGQG
jgi:hypothetical protein